MMHDGHEVVGWVTILGAREAKLFEVFDRLLRWSLVDKFSCNHEDEVVEQFEYFRARLMYGHSDCFISGGC